MSESGTATEAVTKALETHQASLRAFVQRRIAIAHVEDVLQVAALRALEKAETLQDPSRVLAWLYQIHRSTLADVGRKLASRRKWEDCESEPSEVSTKGGESTWERCGCSAYQARMLKSSYAEILQLVDLEDHTIAEASKQLGISTNNATVRLHRARAALRERMLAHCGVERPSDCISCKCVDDGCCAA